MRGGRARIGTGTPDPPRELIHPLSSRLWVFPHRGAVCLMGKKALTFFKKGRLSPVLISVIPSF